MASGGTLTIRTSNRRVTEPLRRGSESVPAGDYVLIEVVDTGTGIPKEIVGRIFEPFFSTKAVGSGTGLGLSTVYGIVRQTGGLVYVESAPGEGANFSILLPRHAAPPEVARPAMPVSTPAKDITGVGTVLLVEDEDVVRLFSVRALRNKGYRVIEAESGEGALELLAQHGAGIDLLVTDVVMRQMDGPTLIRNARETHPKLKVICIPATLRNPYVSAWSI